MGGVFTVLLTVAVIALGVCLALLAKPDLFGDPELQAIARTRALNFARIRLDLPLAGTPDLANLDGRLAASGLALGAPVLIRIFKREFELELWMARDGKFQRFATYPICRWSGVLGPKFAHGDRQAPEGFYTVDADQMNPNSRWHRSFNVGFPNAFDHAHGRTGSALMVHGGCSSAGCYAMTNPVIDEIWRLTTAALPKQPRFQVQIYPFRMSEENINAHAGSSHVAFWRQLKQGSDLFEQTLIPPRVQACQGAYRFQPGTSAGMVPAMESKCTPPKVSDGTATKKAL